MNIIIKTLGRVDYAETMQAMQAFTLQREADTADEIWLVEHHPVFTQGQAGRAEHVLAAGDIPIVQSDRGGQVTYHGPGQCVLYSLIDLRRRQMTIRDLVSCLEQSVVDLLARYAITAQSRCDAPGVYVGEKKICSLGLRVKRGCSYHGLALNVAMDMEPFARINPCGFAGMQMTQITDHVPAVTRQQIEAELPELFSQRLPAQA